MGEVPLRWLSSALPAAQQGGAMGPALSLGGRSWRDGGQVPGTGTGRM